MKSTIFHIKNYFNLKVSLPPLYFLLLYLIATFASAPVLLGFVDPTQLEGILTGEILRIDLLPRIGFAFYELLLLPLYIKRLHNIGWKKMQRDIAILSLLLPVILSTVLSDGGYALMANFIAFMRLLALILTFLLFVLPTKRTDNTL